MSLILLADEVCKASSYFYGFFGAVIALVFAAFGSAYGVAKNGIGICVTGSKKPEQVMKSVIPAIMASIVGIYGLIISIVTATTLGETNYSSYKSFADLAAGISVGLSGIGAGVSLGIVGDAGVRASAQQPRVFTGMLLILIFAEALGIYGLIVGLILTQRTTNVKCSAAP
ncbi:v-type proton atpase 16 kda proteolipid subunit [Anaeramoeba flamelloides]|uniref:V-type proton ATPase proteolipid subunit n=2 Tax=Anaeramoeba flamelloides TaxID=1746091 RepID=A0AAV7YLX2_9EUKA|nr:v-type proton atpase 16 kda proteolipid subunit [Anaeramoeba flamelloides]KAJ3431896.1 v-type proton atpase 16 kda proteolipid subunit [Anaeramoeba flamelloides]KAJ6253288.1 v-type proton atpase 16 kda proteolipid subunit [Anaeramoeba flamelloides]KAJ6254234.1 v-type proton atpase 16 kda proteolipid subunit [Anaeramoeba flamelloides]KAJ6254237.1 v-type proton atpase 16 kda proteolipid subunit [Anaeramoeba flamelloides]|eukprot:Anaeramoba_flamelloidesa3513_69.p1 GENE.a3513_69~~a3513_69.p1  ORF type:complete len:171 (+),score=27.98 a3513_69:20-532(+)